jgi:signal peptidase II
MFLYNLLNLKIDLLMTFIKSKKLFLLGLLIAFLSTFFDLLSKKMIFAILDNNVLDGNIHHPQIKITSFFNLVRVRNNGVSFGMFHNLEYAQIVFSILQIAIIIVLLILLYKNTKGYLTIAFSLIIGGALGNLIDRIRYKAVADFLDFHLFAYHWPAFNLADSVIFIGVAMLLFEELLIKK